jgi:hypothetical protein
MWGEGSEARCSWLVLQELDLSHNQATAELGVVAGKALAAANTSLTTLLLAGNKLGASGGCAVAASIVTNTSLKVLNLQDCGLRDRGSIALANALEANRSLAYCNVCNNAISEYGGLAWSDTLWSNASLSTLILSENPLGDQVAVNIAGVMSRNQTLARLDLASCKVSDEGALSIIDALESNTSLVRLKLSDNLISEAGGMIMADMVETHGALQRLEIKANQVSHSSQLRIARECVRKKQAATTREPRALAAQMQVLERKQQRILECQFRITRAVAAREEAERVLADESRLLADAQAESRTRISAAQVLRPCPLPPASHLSPYSPLARHGCCRHAAPGAALATPLGAACDVGALCTRLGGGGQTELTNLLQQVEDAEKRLEDKQTEKVMVKPPRPLPLPASPALPPCRCCRIQVRARRPQARQRERRQAALTAASCRLLRLADATTQDKLLEKSKAQLASIEAQIAGQEEDKIKVANEMDEANIALNAVKQRKAERVAQLTKGVCPCSPPPSSFLPSCPGCAGLKTRPSSNAARARGTALL